MTIAPVFVMEKALKTGKKFSKSADELEAVCRKCVKVEVSDTKALSDGDFSVTMTDSREITFSNTASELSSVDVGKLIDRFYTVDSARKSTGLGLSIAKLLTERMGGHISADYRGNMLSITLSFN